MTSNNDHNTTIHDTAKHVADGDPIAGLLDRLGGDAALVRRTAFTRLRATAAPVDATTLAAECDLTIGGATMAEDDRARSTAAQGSAEKPPGMPRWVKYLLGALLAVVVAAIVIMLIAGGNHGPGRHGALASGESRNIATTSPA